MRHFYLSLAAMALLATAPLTATAGWGFSYHHDYVAPPPYYHHHHAPPPHCGPYGCGYVERYYYPPPRAYYPPPHRHGPPRGGIWIGF